MYSEGEYDGRQQLQQGFPGEKITILELAGFRRDDNAARLIIGVSASSCLLFSNSTLPLLLVYPA